MFHFTWLTPTPVWQIVLGRWIGGSLVALVAVAPAVRARRGGRRRARDASDRSPLAAVVEAVAYVALFIAIGCITRRTAVWSLAFVFLVERLLGAALTGIAQLSPTWESRAVLIGLMDDAPCGCTARASPTPVGRRPARGHHHRRAGHRHAGGCATCASPALPTDVPNSLCVTAYVVDDVCGDIERG